MLKLVVLNHQNRDNKLNSLTDKEGRPISVDLYPGNTNERNIFLPTVEKIKELYKLSRVVIAGDRGLISSKDITILHQTPGYDWISALSPTSIESLMAKSKFSISFFGEDNFMLIYSSRGLSRRKANSLVESIVNG
jgi:hypothetical protein